MDTLLRKLGYRDQAASLLWRVPDNIAPALSAMVPGEEPSFLLAFVRDGAELAEAALDVAPLYRRGGHLWLAYAKKSGRIRSDINRDSGWQPIAALGMVAVTQIAIDEDWSALRFRYRDEVRKLTRRSEQPRDS